MSWSAGRPISGLSLSRRVAKSTCSPRRTAWFGSIWRLPDLRRFRMESLSNRSTASRSTKSASRRHKRSFLKGERQQEQEEGTKTSSTHSRKNRQHPKGLFAQAHGHDRQKPRGRCRGRPARQEHVSFCERYQGQSWQKCQGQGRMST